RGELVQLASGPVRHSERLPRLARSAGVAAGATATDRSERGVLDQPERVKRSAEVSNRGGAAVDLGASHGGCAEEANSWRTVVVQRSAEGDGPGGTGLQGELP